MSDDPIKDTLRLMPYGFYSITSRHGDERNIMVANWVMQTSFEPRYVALGLQRTSYTHNLIENGKVFAVNIFYKDDDEIIKSLQKVERRIRIKLRVRILKTDRKLDVPNLMERQLSLSVG